MAIVIAGAAPAAPQQAPTAARERPSNGTAAAAQEFDDRLQGYLAFRQSLVDTLAPMSTTPSAAELTTRKQSLAAAIEHGRKGAPVGNLIPPETASVIRREIARDLKARPPAAKEQTLEEVPQKAPVINAPYPDDAPMATVPPLLLQRLPRLPETLQYRYYGRHLVLLDSDVAVILDYVPNVLPPH